MCDWRKIHELSWAERWTLLCALAGLPVTAAGLRWLGVRRCRATLARIAPLKKPREMDAAAKIDTARRVGRLVQIAARHGAYHANCLERSLVLWWLLRRQGLPSAIRYGARFREGAFEAHAWVECQGQIIGDSLDVRERFTPFEPWALLAGVSKDKSS